MIAGTAAAYAAQLRRLFGSGDAWPAAAGSRLDQLAQGIAGELARIDAAKDGIVAEADPRTASDTLAAWERILGLPGTCDVAPPQSVENRRSAVLAKLTAFGGASVAYFTELLERAGATAVLVEKPAWFIADVSAAGDALWDPSWAFGFRVTATAPGTLFIAEESYAGDPLEDSLLTFIQCLVNQVKPAHTVAVFNLTTS